jgi:hypothetical protein
MQEIKGVLLGDTKVGKRTLLDTLKTHPPNIMLIHDSQSNAEYRLVLDILPPKYCIMETK